MIKSAIFNTKIVNSATMAFENYFLSWKERNQKRNTQSEHIKELLKIS